MKKATMLTTREKEQLDLQLSEHCEQDIYETCFELDTSNSLERFIMYPNVIKPMSSVSLGRFLHRHPTIYQNKILLDMGSGSGIQGIIAARRGAKEVVFSDIDHSAYLNTSANDLRFCRHLSTRVIKGNLFENIQRQVDVAVFAQPYFPDCPLAEYPVTVGMLDPGILIQRFLKDAQQFVIGPIYMPFLDWISDANNPRVQGVKLGYAVREVHSEELFTGIQIGRFSVYELTY